MRPHPLNVVVMVGALVGLVFAGFATHDFAQHLDRQVHSVHCSFVPGLAATDASGASGCAVTLMSPYSSVFRTWIWGGIPISLPAMSVFAFILFFAGDLVLRRRQTDRRSTGFLALATVLPAGASLVMGIISFGTLGAACKLCIAMYVASAACLGGAIALWRRAARTARAGGEEPDRAARPPSPGTTWEGPAPAPGQDPAWASGSAPDDRDPAWVAQRAEPASGTESTAVARPAPAVQTSSGTSYGYLAGAFAIGVAMVLVPVLTYAAIAPDHGRFIGTCGSLEDAGDRYDVMVPLDDHTGGVAVIEVLDPMCPACAGFDARLEASGLTGEIHRQAVLFPLDDECNWMVDDAIHPGACTVSEAVLCADERAAEVLAWAFEEQAEISGAERARPGAAADLVAERFPEVASCVGSSRARSQLNQSLRWAVSNHLPVLTPQFFVEGVRLCDEDTDLGLDFALSTMLERQRRGELAAGGEP